VLSRTGSFIDFFRFTKGVSGRHARTHASQPASQPAWTAQGLLEELTQCCMEVHGAHAPVPCCSA
jgi:hypothetical protein